MKIRGTHVLITGASRGVGYHVAQVMVDRGATVTGSARDTERLYQSARDIGFEPLAADLTDFTETCALVARAEKLAGPVDILINNAGINIPGVLAYQDNADLRTVVTTNLLAPMVLTSEVLPQMVEAGHGAIVNVSSGTGEMAMRNVIPYGSTKTGLTMSTRALQRELRGTGVTAHLAVLGVVDTDMIADTNKDPVGAAIARRFGVIPVNHPADVGERIARQIERNRQVCFTPRLADPLHRLRLLPTRLADLVLIGSPKSFPAASSGNRGRPTGNPTKGRDSHG